MFGGKDIGIGHMNDLWCMNLQDETKFMPGESEYNLNAEWELVETQGASKPKPLANHTCVEYQGKMYLFGGSNLGGENLQMHTLDLHRN